MGDGRAGLLTPAQVDALVEAIHERSGGQSRQATGWAASNVDVYQVNCTYYDALGRDDMAYLLARAVQFFTPGIPQIYYVGLLAGHNDMDLVARSGVGRDINRHVYAPDEIARDLARPVVAALVVLAGLVQGLIPGTPDARFSPQERDAFLEEQEHAEPGRVGEQSEKING